MTEQRKPVELTRELVIEIIVAEVSAFPRTGPDKCKEHIRLYDHLIPPKEIKALWADRHAELRKIEEAKPSSPNSSHYLPPTNQTRHSSFET